MNTGNTGLSPFYTPSPNVGNSGIGLKSGGYQYFHLAHQSFAPSEVALTVVAAVVMVATVVLVVRRLRVG